MHDLLAIGDLHAGDVTSLLETAAAVKAEPTSVRGRAAGRAVAVVFEKPSLRTRFSVEAAAARLGAHPIGAYDEQAGIGTREPLDDAARVLERYVEAIVMRTFDHGRVSSLAAAASVPVINALSDAHHPLQALADLLTVAEARCGGDIAALKTVRIAWVGDGNNVARSLAEACAHVGAELRVASPAGYELEGHEGANDAAEAVAGADVVCTDVWASMGQEGEADRRREVFEPYRVTADLMSRAADDAVFLHCLPAHRGEEVDAAVIDGPASRVFDQAENRLHTTVAVLLHVWGLL